MSWTLFRTTMKSNWMLLLVFVLIMALYLSIIVWMYSGAGDIQGMLDAMPDVLMEAMGFTESAPGLTGFVSGYFYGFLVILFPMIFCIILGNGLIARHVDSGSMAYLLATPISRVRLAVTQAVCFLFNLVLLFGAMVLVGVATSAAMFPGELDTGAFLMLNAGAFLLFITVSGIAFFSSCLFSESAYSLAFASGVLVFFFLVEMLSEVAGAAEWLAKLSLFSLYDAQSIATGDTSALVRCLIFAVVGLVFYAAGVVVFDKKDLPV